MKYKRITREEYETNPVPVQFAGYYILNVHELGLPTPESFFVEDTEPEKEVGT